MASNGSCAHNDHADPAGGFAKRGELADRGTANPVGHVERRRIESQVHVRRHIGRVDDMASNIRQVRHLTGHPGAEAPVAQVVGTSAKKRTRTGREEPVVT